MKTELTAPKAILVGMSLIAVAISSIPYSKSVVTETYAANGVQQVQLCGRTWDFAEEDWFIHDCATELAKELRVQEIGRFQPGDHYESVRKRVIGYGYQLDGDLSEEMGYSQAFQLRDINGWTEVTHCWPTGASQCEYRFRWNNRFYLFLYTAGECYDEQSFCDLSFSGEWRVEDIR